MSQKGPRRTSSGEVRHWQDILAHQWRSGAVPEVRHCKTPYIYSGAAHHATVSIAGAYGVLQRRFLWLEDCVRRVSGLYVLKPTPFWSLFLFEKSGSTGPMSARPKDGRGGARTGRAARISIGRIVPGADRREGRRSAQAMRQVRAQRALGGQLDPSGYAGSGKGQDGRHGAKIGGFRLGASDGR